MSKPPLCKICRERPAAVPDRNKLSLRWRREICRECHAERLQGDLAEVLTANMVAHKLRDEAQREYYRHQEVGDNLNRENADGAADDWHYLPELPEPGSECIVAYMIVGEVLPRVGMDVWEDERWLTEAGPLIYAWQYAPEAPEPDREALRRLALAARSGEGPRREP